MKATPYSKEPYFPVLLSNGQDGILVNYTGTCVCPLSGHNNAAELSGVSCGWYKATTRAVTKRPISQILRAGIQVELFGGACMPGWYEQALRAEEGILETKLVFGKKMRLTVESFLTDDGLWGEKITVDRCPADYDPKLGFALLRTYSGYAHTDLQDPPTLRAAARERGFDFTYTIAGCRGLGALWADAAFDAVTVSKDYYYDATGTALGLYTDVKEGMAFARLLTCVDETECEDADAELARREKLASEGYEAVRAAHVAAYRKRRGTAGIRVPDEAVQSLYDTSVFTINGHYNRRSGAVSIGNLPDMWGGGLHCAYDAGFILQALLTGGNADAAACYKRFFAAQGKLGRDALQRIGKTGTAFLGWTDARGGFARVNRDVTQWLLEEKPMYDCCEILNRWYVWKYTDRTLDAETESILWDALAFIEENLLLRRDGKTHLVAVQAGTEGGFRVENDTFTILVLAAALRALADMLGEERLVRLAADLTDDLAGNYDGKVLMPFANAPYTGGGQLDYYLYSLPDPIPIESVHEALRSGKTPWGCTFDQFPEEKRHWPWIHPRAAICYAHEGEHALTLEHIRQMPDASSAVGAVPEYIRMDGLPVHYWYTTAHGLIVWALHEAFAHLHKGTLRLAWGFAKAWQDFSCSDIVPDSGLRVSFAVERGALTRLRLENRGERDITVALSLCPEFAADGLPASCTVPAGGVHVWESPTEA